MPGPSAEPVLHAVLAAVRPGWHGSAEVPGWPRRLVLALRVSAAVATIAAIVLHGRTFRHLSPEVRESVIHRLAHSGLAPLRALAQWWKLVAVVTGPPC